MQNKLKQQHKMKMKTKHKNKVEQIVTQQKSLLTAALAGKFGFPIENLIYKM